MEQKSALNALPARLVAGPPPEKKDEKLKSAEKSKRLKAAEEKASNG